MSVYPPPAAPAQPFGHRPSAAAETPADPLDGARFGDFFEARVAPGLQALEAERTAAVQRFWRSAMLAGALAALAVLALAPFWGGRLIIVPLGLCAFYVNSVLWKPLRALGDQAKERLLTIVCEALGFSYQLGGFQPPGYDRLGAMGLLPKSDRQSFDDLFTGARDGAAFAVCDAWLQEEHENGKSSSMVTVFRGQLIRLAFPKSFLGETVIARDKGLLNGLHRPPGMERVGLGSSQFERQFEVYSTDQVEARFLVHPAFMQKLLDMEAAFQGCNLRGLFCEGELLLAVEGRDRFDFGNPLRPFDRLEDAQAVADDLAHVLGVIDFVLAGPPPAPELSPA